MSSLVWILRVVGVVWLRYARAVTPEAMIAANRYGVALPNPSGEFAVYSVTNYSWADRATTAWYNRVDLSTGEMCTWYQGSGISELVFVGDGVLYLNGTNEKDDGGVSLYYADADALSDATLVASLPAPYSGLKASMTKDGDIHFLVYTKAWRNGTAYNERLSETPRSSARIYTELYPRHWDYWRSERLNAIFGGVLRSQDAGSFVLEGSLKNYVTGTCNVTCRESPYDLNDAGDYDLSPDGTKLVFMAKDIDLPLANYTSTQIWYVEFDASAEDAVRINPRGSAARAAAQGASSDPRFSPDSKQIAYLQQDGINYESDRAILYVANADPERWNITALASDWDRVPANPVWSKDASTIFVSAADLGRSRIFPVPLTAGDSYVPTNITDEGVAAGYFVLPDETILVSDSKLWTSRDMFTITAHGTPVKTYFQANLVDDALAGLGPQDVGEFYYSSNTTDIRQQAWIVYPEGFDRSQRYPLAFIVHGGPQGAQYNAWSVRWNLKVWADQGYVVVAPNPVGSIGWGQNLTDAVAARWQSYPYWDIVHAWTHVNATLDYVDTSRGILAGASFGGYMANWVQGQEMGRWFTALVTHDGTVNSLHKYSTDELWFMDHDMGGPFNSTALYPGSPWFDSNPLLHHEEWKTPHFVVHNDLDYRLAVSEGTLLFNLLQVKGVPSKFLNFPDENHWVTGRENSLVWHEEIFKWINYWSGLSNASSPY